MFNTRIYSIYKHNNFFFFLIIYLHSNIKFILIIIIIRQNIIRKKKNYIMLNFPVHCTGYRLVEINLEEKKVTRGEDKSKYQKPWAQWYTLFMVNFVGLEPNQHKSGQGPIHGKPLIARLITTKMSPWTHGLLTQSNGLLNPRKLYKGPWTYDHHL